MLATVVKEAVSSAPQLPSRRAAPAKAKGMFERWPGRLLSPTLGLELAEISLKSDFGDAEIDALRRLLARHRVLVFRDQQITPAAHVAFARRFGDLEVHPFIKHHPDHPELVTFIHDNGNIGIENI